MFGRLVAASVLAILSLTFSVSISNQLIWQILFATIGLQLSIQIAFRFVPNGLKVLAVAAFFIVFIRLIWALLDWNTRKELFCCDSTVSKATPSCVLKGQLDQDCEDELDCWEDPIKRANRNIDQLLLETSHLSRDIDRFLEVNVAEE